MTTPTDQFDAQIPMLLRLFENSLRSGYNITQSLAIIAEDIAAPASSDIQNVLADLEAGVSLSAALERWLEHTPSADLNLILATLRVQFEVGGNLADKFQLLAQILQNRRPLPSAQ